MKSIQLMILIVSLLIVTGYYSLYNSDDREELNAVFDCLYAYITDSYLVDDGSYQSHYQLIPYCRRFDENEKHEKFSIISYENVENQMKFSELYRKGVTSLQLLDWSAPIDVAERYEENGQNSDEIFSNCSYPWFGATCQYRLIDNTLPSFGRFVGFIITKRGAAPSNTNFLIGTCYPFLNTCYRGPSPMCLDWREICDGKFDCINGEDEEFCQILEINGCSDNEFQCHYSAECIPWSFVQDGMHSIDCLDSTDEITGLSTENDGRSYCHAFPTFQCEESANPRRGYFPCGDGQFIGNFPPNFEGYCRNLRDRQMTFTILTSLDYISELNCQRTLSCLLRIDKIDSIPSIEDNNPCESLSNHCISERVIFPEYPIMFGLFQFIYLTNRSIQEFKENILPDLICFNQSYCPGLLFCSVDIGMHNGLNCCQTDNLTEGKTNRWDSVPIYFYDLIRRCLFIGRDANCSESSLFYCSKSSKCIAKRQLVDGREDCYFGEDEAFSTCELNDSKRVTCMTQPNKCYSVVVINDKTVPCLNSEYENLLYKLNVWKKPFPFERICDGYEDLRRKNISDNTDETDCRWWPCNNPYIRCDGYWHCLNGIDELNCSHNPCSSNENVCINSESDFEKKFCFPTTDFMEDYTKFDINSVYRNIYLTNETINNTRNYLFWNQTKCITEQHLYQGHSLPSLTDEDVCLMQHDHITFLKMVVHLMKNKRPLCTFSHSYWNAPEQRPFFRTSRLSYFPSVLSTEVSIRTTNHLYTSKNFDLPLSFDKYWYCNRGILILFQSNNSYQCLCPPSYFGNRCQWQNQRISLTIQLIYRSLTYVMPVFQIIVILIDEKGEIGPYHEQITYVPKRDCGTKFNIYLLYPDQPKNSLSNYSIHIDIFDKMTLTYWSSWHLSIPFQFLPVNRIVSQLFIPNLKQTEFFCPLSCGNHGKCHRYVNKNSSYFCQCNRGYSGLKCHIKNNCSCSSDSYCLTSSICICPMNKFGRKCYLKHSFCQSSNNSCENNGQCIPIDDRIGMEKFTCLCKENFYGIKCEYKIENMIDIQFDENIIKTDSPVFLHFITSFQNANPQHTTTLKKVKYGQNTIKLYATKPFHILFLELLNGDYYLVVLRETFIQSEYIQAELLPNQQCVFIDRLLNITLKSYSYLHRVKYYPYLCRQNKKLMCFYDENYICICDLDRFSNCFVFDHNKTYDCQGQNDCENGGKCFQDNATCSSTSLCVCPDCFYGTACQFTTHGFVLSLDYILSYHIKPNVSLSQQPIIVKMSLVIITVMSVFGLINGILSIVTFNMKNTRNVGCGFYLLVSGWISVLIITVLIIKFCQLILFQMMILPNRTLFTINCILLDMILKVLIASNDWLDGCVSMERIVTVTKGVRFDKNKSKKLAKWVTVSVIIVTILTHLHDPLHRHIVNDIDIDEQRTWCLVKYSPSINTFNSFITLFHFLIPFSINSLSMIIVVILIARSRSTVQRRLSFIQHFKLQFKEHKHHLLATCALVFLALPRLILSFISGCMKSPRNSWLFLFAYFISFLPSMMTFIVYILTSKTYTQEFNTVVQRTIRQFRNII